MVPSAATLNVGLLSLSRYLPSSDLTAVGSTACSAKANPSHVTSAIVTATSQTVRKILSSAFDTDVPARGKGSTRQHGFPIKSLWQCEHCERSTERCVVTESLIAAHCAETFGRLGQASRKTDARPAADAGQHSNILLATLLVGCDVTDDPRRGLELVEFLARLGIDRFEVAFECSVEHHPAGGGESTRPDREQLLVRPDDLAGLAVPGDEVTHVALAGRRIHRERRPYIGLARGIAHLERLVVHTDMVRRNVEQLR